MYPLGHLGVALVLSAPVAYALHPRTATGFTVFTLLAALLPDVDKSLPYLTHHGITHTVVFAVFTGLVGGGAAAAGISGLRRFTDSAIARRFSPTRIFTFVGLGLFLGVLSHVLADVVVTFPGTKPVSPFWPVSSRRVQIEFLGLGGVVHNAVLFALGLLAQFYVARQADGEDTSRSAVA